MSIRRVVPDVSSERFDESRQFYVDVLGFEVVMDPATGRPGSCLR
jgi:catechol 2,3-dioxygenase-like lactoylglutathione lyase family enzyme